MTIKVALAGAGAFGIKHLDGIKNIDGVEVVSLIGRDLAKTREVADKYGMAHVTDDLAETWPSRSGRRHPVHAHADARRQAIACLKAGKHVQVEIPLADTLAGAEAAACNSKPAWWPCAATPAASTPATSGCTRRLPPASSTSSRWMCKPTSSAAPI
jgi:2-hydroxy-4-carboxymuconate semialdehyde hemiacetal dehydrogenase